MESRRIKCYVVNLEERTDRLKTIREEFERVGWDSPEVVVALRPDSERVKFLGQGLDLVTPHSWGSNRGLEIACLASHLEAIRRIAEGTDTEGIVLEDDILLRREFADMIWECRDNFPEEADLVYLSCTVGSNVPRLWDGKAPEKHNIVRRKDRIVWGCLMYWLTRTYARKLLHLMGERPLSQNLIYKDIITSELISCHTIPYQTIPILAIEDPINKSCLRSNKEAPPDFLTWGWEYYGPIESWNWRAPLYRMSLEKLGPNDKDQMGNRINALSSMNPDLLTGDGFFQWSLLLLRYSRGTGNRDRHLLTHRTIIERMRTDPYVNRLFRDAILTIPDLIVTP